MKDKKYKVVEEIFFGFKDTIVEKNLTEEQANSLLKELKKDEDAYHGIKKLSSRKIKIMQQKNVEVIKIIDRIKDIIFRSDSSRWDHISMVLPKFYDDGSGYIDTIAVPNEKLFEFDSLDDFIIKGNQWIDDNENGISKSKLSKHKEYRVCQKWVFGKWQYFPEYRKKEGLFKTWSIWYIFSGDTVAISFNTKEEAWDFIEFPEKININTIHHLTSD